MQADKCMKDMSGGCVYASIKDDFPFVCGERVCMSSYVFETVLQHHTVQMEIRIALSGITGM